MMGNDPNRQLEQQNTKNKRAEEALPRSHDEPDRRLKALTAELASAKKQLVASSEHMYREIEQRKQTEEALKERLKFEELLSDISARFININPDQIDAEIHRALKQILEFFQVDRCGLVRVSPNETSLRITHVAYAPEISPVPENADLPIALFPWVYEKIIKQHEVVSFTTRDELPGEAAVDRQTYEELEIRSSLNIPISFSAALVYIISINAVRKECAWPEKYIPRLRLLGEILVNTLQLAQTRRQLEKENIYLREEIELQNVHEEIVGRSRTMKRILAQVEQVARTDTTVLIEGETGTGKEILARAVHRLSARKDRPLVTVNCASLPPTLIESELFGREKGAYTGALTRMTGRFEVADGATLFLDEIGELPHDVQAKLLRVLEHGRFERLGSTKPLQVNVRTIAATNRDLARDADEGKFRKDLYYRLNVFPIVVPPLRERPEDIPLLVWTFVRQYEKKMGKRIDHIPRKSMEALQRYPWPGNARELRNVVEHAMIVSSSKTLDIDIPQRTSSEIPANLSLEAVDRRHILDVLQKSGWRLTGQGGAAEILGLKRTTLQSKMKKLGIRRPAR
jgi:formate hydrogenlyase transcriptional activator